MASARYAWGIDIGNRALKAVKLVRDGDQLRIDDFDVIEHEHVLSNAGDNREELIKTALANFVQRHPGKKGGVVAIGVAGQASFARFIKLPPVEEKKIPEIVRFEAIQQIPFPLDEVEWSYQLFRSAESPDVEVGIFAMRKDLIAKHISNFTDVDLNTQVVQMNPLAVYNAVYFDQRLKGTTMVIDLGAENTDLIICDNDSVWMRSIPIGGNNFTETLVKAFKLPFAKAEDLKRNAATSKYARQIFQAMRPVFADLVAEIQRSEGFYASVHRESKIEKILALGGTFRLPGLQKYLQQNLSRDVERLDNFTAGAPTDPKQAAAFMENLPSMASAYGLALQAMGEGKITSSLLPAAIRRAKIWKEKVPIFAAAAACFVAGAALAGAGYFYQNLQYEGASQKRGEINSVQTAGQGVDTAWNTVENAGAPERAKMSNLLNLMQYRGLWDHLLQDVAKSAPQPQPEVAKGLAENNADLVKQVPRGKRTEIVIETIQSHYVPALATVIAASQQDLSAMVNQASGAFAAPSAAVGMAAPAGAIGEGEGNGNGNGNGNGPPPAAAPPAAAAGAADASGRGFVLVIRGTSPNSDGHALVEEKFCAALKKLVPTPENQKMAYAVKRAVTVSANQIKEDPTRMQTMLTKYNEVLTAQQRSAAGGQGGGGGGPAGNYRSQEGDGGMPPGAMPNPALGQPAATGQPQVDEAAPYRDRLTGEDMRDDWEFTVLIAVQVDPPAPAPAAPQQQASAQ